MMQFTTKAANGLTFFAPFPEIVTLQQRKFCFKSSFHFSFL
jgi:hypothetical protein